MEYYRQEFSVSEEAEGYNTALEVALHFTPTLLPLEHLHQLILKERG